MRRLIPETPGASPSPEGGGPTTAAGLESPSLFANGADGPAAYEMKFLLTEDQAAAVEGFVRGRLALDPHADPALGNAYLTTSLYTDTPKHDILFRSPLLGGCKHRVRRYGPDGPVFVERKERKGDRVRKRRSRIDSPGLPALAASEPADGWPGDWFHREVLERALRPVCRIAYERVAYLGVVDGGTVRVTFDRHVRGEVADGWAVHPVRSSAVLLPERVIGEFKFRLALPGLFKGIVEELGLAPGPVSKYRLFMQTLGLSAPAGASDA